MGEEPQMRSEKYPSMILELKYNKSVEKAISNLWKAFYWQGEGIQRSIACGDPLWHGKQTSRMYYWDIQGRLKTALLYYWKWE